MMDYGFGLTVDDFKKCRRSGLNFTALISRKETPALRQAA
jgi:hypothetical protein